jgi:hypothetical protein
VHGKRIEFYEFPKGVLVMESGKAEGPVVLAKAPQLQALLKTNRLVDLFTALRPDLPVPPALRDIQTRHPVLTSARKGGRTRSTGSGEKIKAASVVANSFPCPNNCCNGAWLYQNICAPNGNWFYYDYGWSWHNATSVSNWHSVVCAAIGTSQFTISGSGSGSWSVPQGWYRWYSWQGSSWASEIDSTVNSRSNQHMHTYCGFDN